MPYDYQQALIAYLNHCAQEKGLTKVAYPLVTSVDQCKELFGIAQTNIWVDDFYDALEGEEPIEDDPWLVSEWEDDYLESDSSQYYDDLC